MQNAISITELPKSLTKFTTLFATLDPIPETAVAGIYRGEFVGPTWLQKIAPPGLKLLRFGGWWGKWLQENGEGNNITASNGTLHPFMPITFETRPSLLDNKLCLAILYPSQSPFPWRHVIDELRILDNGVYLGMTITNLPLVNKLPFPFILNAQPTGPEVTAFQENYIHTVAV